MSADLPGFENDAHIDSRFADPRRAMNAGSTWIRAEFRLCDALARNFHVLFTTLGRLAPLPVRVPRAAWRKCPSSYHGVSSR